MLCELSSTETYKSRDWRKMKKYKHHANQFLSMVKSPNLQDSSCCPNSIPEMEILEEDCFKFLDELSALILECQC
jgi:hypothetical protein